MTEILDLFGDPIPRNHGMRGRPAHVRTWQNRNKVLMLLALGWSNERIANALDISQPTLRQYYFSELEQRSLCRDRLDARLAMRLWEQVEDGNVTAMKEFQKLLERNDSMIFGQVRHPAESDDPPAPKLGKKEQAELAARTPDLGSALGELMARRQGDDDGPLMN